MLQVAARSSCPTRPDVAGQPLPRPLGRYTLVEPLDRGGMAELHLARAGDGSVVVIKQLPLERVGDPLFTGMLATEAELTRHAAHPNVVRLLGLGRQRLEHGPSPYLVLEYVPGLDLRQLLSACARRGLRFPVSLGLGIVKSLLAALDAAHRARDELGAPLDLVHRDVSPANLLIGFDGQVKLCDFGIAAAATAADQQAEMVLGKPSYMSPEQARGERLDRRADVYAAGVILWELLAGRRMRKGSEAHRLGMAMAGRIGPLREIPGLPAQERLQALVQRALAPSAAARHPNAGAMLRELDGYLAATGLEAGPVELGGWLERNFAADMRRANAQIERVRATPSSPAPLDADVGDIEPDDLSRPRRAVRPERPFSARPWWRAEVAHLVTVGALSFAAALSGLSLVRFLGLM